MSAPLGPPPPGPYVTSVRALCEFAAKRGDLDRRFTPSPSAQEGQAGHTLVQARRSAAFASEVAVQMAHGDVLVRGRADLWSLPLQRLEEIKTHRGPLERQPDNHRHLHWAQARVYAWLLCHQHALAQVEVALVYVDIDTQRETVLSEAWSAAALQAHFEGLCQTFSAWARHELAHRARRAQALGALRFPHGAFRPGQREMAESVYRAGVQGRVLLMQAPTGIGKTMGTVFPALKAWQGSSLDKVFYLTAKTPGRQRAVEALGALAPQLVVDGEPALRGLELTARDKACEHPDKACHGGSCPLAQGFYDRLPAAREAACQRAVLDRHGVREVALRHEVCPYYLAQDMVRWSDVVVGDFNHFFDDSALLHALAVQEGWRAMVLVDEAHNLIERARGMYSASLGQALLHPGAAPCPATLKKPLARLRRQWSSLDRASDEPWLALPEVPEGFVRALTALLQAFAELEQSMGVATDGTQEDPPRREAPTAEASLPSDEAAPWQNLHLQALALKRRIDTLADHSLVALERADLAPGRRPDPLGETLSIRNLRPAAFLKPRFGAAHSVVLFSATLQPAGHHLGLLGLPENTVVQDIASPFQAHQLSLHIARDVSTRYADRQASLPELVRRMAQQYQARPGNYLAFFSSFDYLEQVQAALVREHPDIPLWPQARRMDESAREAFVERFTDTSQGLGLAVLGGAFSEGIDLPGPRLIGAFIATLGLPQINPFNEALRQNLQAHGGEGWKHTYLYPGLQKVVQAAGRVIRGPDDTGVIHLLDDRFAGAEVRGLLPRWWRAS